MNPDLLAALGRLERRALPRLLTLAGRGEPDVARWLEEHAPRRCGRVVLFTGSGGVGKSTLLGKLIERIRERKKTVAVLACDPESPLTGGALLGDRFRMGDRDDPGVFIRSLAAPGGSQAIAPHLSEQIRLLGAFAFDYVLVETVGAGQGDTSAADLADRTVLLLQPETGDDLQWEKAGVLEVADVVVVHKADLPGAEDVLAQVRAALELGPHRDVRVLGVSSKTNAGLDELLTLLDAPPPDRDERTEDNLWRAVREALAERGTVLRSSPAYRDLLEQWRGNATTTSQAVRSILEMLSYAP